jgi:hypothetical protein
VFSRGLAKTQNHLPKYKESGKQNCQTILHTMYFFAFQNSNFFILIFKLKILIQMWIVD